MKPDVVQWLCSSEIGDIGPLYHGELRKPQLELIDKLLLDAKVSNE